MASNDSIQPDGLVAHWPLGSDTASHAGTQLDCRARDVETGLPGPPGGTYGAALFNGRSSCIEVADHPALHLGHGEATIAAWINSDTRTNDVVGTILSKFDTDLRRGLHLYILTNDAVTISLANSRQLSFGMDDAQADSAWTDCGRPGNAILISGLAVVDGTLYAGTMETGLEESGHLWRYAGGQHWVDLGNPIGCNAVHGIAEFEGQLYCALGRYACQGSCLGETRNLTPGGQVFRVDADGTWTDCGHPGEAIGLPDAQEAGPYNFGKADDAFALNVHHGSLYCVNDHLPGVYIYRGDREWENIGPDQHVISLAVYRDALYALGNGGSVYRYDEDGEWTNCGTPEGSRQTYGAVIANGEFFVGTWPNGQVFRYDGGTEWVLIGRLGYEMEVMSMAMYNSKVYLGSLPMANVWRMDGKSFNLMANVDNTPVKLRRAWSMAIYDGRLYAGTLPSGHVHSFQAGRQVTWDRRFPDGWHHVAAVKGRHRLKLYVDGELQACSTPFHRSDFNLDTDTPLTIGAGPYEQFSGLMSDVRLYNRALPDNDVRELAQQPDS